MKRLLSIFILLLGLMAGFASIIHAEEGVGIIYGNIPDPARARALALSSGLRDILWKEISKIVPKEQITSNLTDVARLILKDPAKMFLKYQIVKWEEWDGGSVMLIDAVVDKRLLMRRLGEIFSFATRLSPSFSLFLLLEEKRDYGWNLITQKNIEEDKLGLLDIIKDYMVPVSWKVDLPEELIGHEKIQDYISQENLKRIADKGYSVLLWVKSQVFCEQNPIEQESYVCRAEMSVTLFDTLNKTELLNLKKAVSEEGTEEDAKKEAYIKVSKEIAGSLKEILKKFTEEEKTSPDVDILLKEFTSYTQFKTIKDAISQVPIVKSLSLTSIRKGMAVFKVEYEGSLEKLKYELAQIDLKDSLLIVNDTPENDILIEVIPK